MSVHTFNDWSASVTALAVAILWQSALLAGLVAGVCWLLRRSAPALRYWCWQIVALKLLLMPWWIVAIPLPDFLAAGAAGISPPCGQDDRESPGQRLAPRWAAWLRRRPGVAESRRAKHPAGSTFSAGSPGVPGSCSPG